MGSVYRSPGLLSGLDKFAEGRQVSLFIFAMKDVNFCLKNGDHANAWNTRVSTAQSSLGAPAMTHLPLD